MFRKLFTPEDKKEDSFSSDSGESEIVTKADIPELPRKRRFFRKPHAWNDKPEISDTKPSTSRLCLPRSKTFSFRQSGQKNQFLCLPRSKSVHFAENILTVRFVDPIPTTQNDGVDWKNVEVPNGTDSSNSEDISSDTLQRVQATLGHIFSPESPQKSKAATLELEGSKPTKDEEDSDTDDSKSFEEEPDSTEQRTTLAQIELLYPIYQQACDLAQLNCTDISQCNLNQMKADIRASLDDSVTNINSTVKIMKGLQAQVREFKSDISTINEENSELHILLKEKDAEVLQLKEQLYTMKNKLSHSELTGQSALEKALKAENSELLQREESSKFEIEQIKRKLDEVTEEKTRALEALDKDNRQKLEIQKCQNEILRQQLEQTKELACSTENKTLQAQIEAQHSTITSLQGKLKQESEKIDGLKQKYKQLVLSEKAKLSELEKVQYSNRIAIDAFRKFIKSSFEALAPIFQPQSIQEYTQAYYGFSQTTVFNESHQSAIALICAFLLTTIRNLLAQYVRNEKALEGEVENRLRYQQEVLSTFTKMTQRILHSQNGRVALGPPKERKKSWN